MPRDKQDDEYSYRKAPPGDTPEGQGFYGKKDEDQDDDEDEK